MFNHLYLKLHDPEKLIYKDDPGWKILIHDRRDTPVIDVRTHGNTLNRGWGKDIRIYIREVSTESLSVQAFILLNKSNVSIESTSFILLIYSIDYLSV